MGTLMTQVSAKDYRVIEETLIALDCARSLTVLILLRYNQLVDIYSLEFNPHGYNCLDLARRTYAATELLRKNKFIQVDSIDKREVALSGFFDCERSCQATNERLLRGNPDYSGLLYSMSRKIANILGELDYDELVVSSGWGPGVTLTLKSGKNSLFDKFRHHGEATPAFLPVASKLIELISPHWKIQPRCFEGNRVITVPKNAKTDRVIAVEPSLNLFFQKGVGAMIRKRLKGWGIDLKDQRRNQELSRSGSFDGNLSTVDFSSASDTISYVLVMQMLPFDWFHLLDILRSPRGLVNDQLIEYEKFSSMGNGFTFELESLIFYAAALAVADEAGTDSSQISVYGDDVILPTSLFNRYTEFCKHLGFSVNNKKSYSSSYFRESCGGYFWHGVSIKPPRLLESLTSLPGAFSFHNRLYDYDVQEEFSQTFKNVRALIRYGTDKSKACQVPRCYGDTGFTVPSRSLMRKGSYKFRFLTNRPSKQVSDDVSVLLTHYYLGYKGNPTGPLPVDSIYRVGDVRIVDSLPVGNEIPIPRKGRLQYKFAVIPYGVVDLDKA